MKFVLVAGVALALGACVDAPKSNRIDQFQTQDTWKPVDLVQGQQRLNNNYPGQSGDPRVRTEAQR